MVEFSDMMKHGTYFDINPSSPMFIYAWCYLNNFLNKYLLKPWEDDVESHITIFPRNKEMTNDKKINEHTHNI